MEVTYKAPAWSEKEIEEEQRVTEEVQEGTMKNPFSMETALTACLLMKLLSFTVISVFFNPFLS